MKSYEILSIEKLIKYQQSANSAIPEKDYKIRSFLYLVILQTFGFYFGAKLSQLNDFFPAWVVQVHMVFDIKKI